jgi:PAS domain S-box-containing protein
MDNTPDGIYFKDLQSRFFLVNRAMHMPGLKNIEEIYGKTDFDFFEPESARLMYEREQEVMRTGQPLVDLEEEEKWPDRPTTWSLTTIMPLRDAKGSIIGIFGVSRGITERKQVEKALRESETRLKEAERMAHLGSFTWEIASDTTIWSDEMYRIAGLEPGAPTPRLAEVAMSYTPESWARLEPAIQRLVETAEPFDMAGERVRPDGSLCYVHMRGVAETDASGQVVRLYGTLQDISELRLAQKNLRQTNQQLNAIIQASPLGISALDGDGRLTLWSPACERLYGWTQAEVLGQEPPMASEELHAEVRQQIRQELQGTQRSGEVYSRRRKDGTLLDISLSTAPLRDSRGNITGSMAIVEDITQRRRAEEALRESETKFRAIFENSRDAIDVSQAGLHVYVNPAFLQLFGYSGSDEIDGQSLFNLVAPEDRQRIIEISSKRSLGQDAPDYYETRGLRKDGSQFDMEVKADTYELQGKRYTLAVMRDVTERKQAEEALRRSEERYRMLADNMTDLIWVMGPDLKYTYTSPSTLRQRGLTMEELNALPLDQQIAPHSLEKVMQLYREILGRENPVIFDPPQPITLELEVYRKDGSSYWSETTFTLILDKQGKLVGILGSGRDVTERKRAEQALRESEERFRTFIEQSAEAVSLVDEEGRLIEWNDSMERLSGLKRQEVAGKFFWDVLNNLIPPEKRSQQAFERNKAALIQALQTGQSPMFNHTIEGEVDRPDGERRYTRQTAFPIKTEKGFRLGSVSQDITELKHTEALRLAKETAEIANRAKSEFLANMSHELRTPLNAMLGFSDMLSQQYFGPLTGKQVEYVQDIHESAAYLLALINDILDLSKIEAGRMDLETSRVDLKSLFEHSLVMVRERANKHALYMSSNLDPRLEGREFLADERKLRQVLYNLLANAVKFTQDGGAVDLSARLVDVAGHQGHPWVEVSVTDTGIGLAADDLERIFEAFYQVKTPEAGKTPGTGLGLSLVRRMVELHGGKVWAESKGPGWGSRFVFTLPLVASQPGEEA